MTVENEYQRLCKAIDLIQRQLFHQGQKDNEFMQADLLSLQNQAWQLYLLTTGKIIEDKPKAEGQRPERRNNL